MEIPVCENKEHLINCLENRTPFSVNIPVLNLESTFQQNKKWVKRFVRSLKENTTTTHLNLKDNRLELKNVKRLFDSLSKNTTLKYLDIGFNSFVFDSETFKNYSNHVVTTLCLERCSIGAKGCEHLSEALKINNSITKLDLSRNEISDEGVEFLGVALSTNTFVKHLILRINEISSSGVDNFRHNIQTNSTLQTLDLSGNKINDNGANCLNILINSNSSITTLILEEINMSEGGVESLSAIMGSLKNLNIRGNEIGDEGLNHLIEALKQNNSLTCLNLKCTQITVRGVTKLKEGLNSNTTLTSLDISDNDLSGQCYIELMKSNNNIVDLKYDGYLDDSFKDEIGELKSAKMFKFQETFSTIMDNKKEAEKLLKWGTYISSLSLKTDFKFDPDFIYSGESFVVKCTLNNTGEGFFDFKESLIMKFYYNTNNRENWTYFKNKHFWDSTIMFGIPFHKNLARGLANLREEFTENEFKDILHKEDTNNLYSLKKEHLNYQTIIKYSIQFCDGLHHLHRHNFCHGDLKPQNAMIDRNDNLVIIDFGISAPIDCSVQFVGGSVYLPPEVCVPIPSRKMQTTQDVFGMGCIIYELLSGQTPFQKNQDTCRWDDYQYFEKSSIYDINRLYFKPDVPEKLKVFVRSCLHRDVKERKTIPELLCILRND
eukprot:TRINITY_DN5547_c0_g1_i1.p1 TRINITY_DN5547_c0_g1~~TRINITY_DN5547_c0_g1_i1.p1  ORF type:complete len:660 (-),score=77.88 TRINITY_DN5547_c0_g1_i1:134-2113(-)